MHDSAAAPTAGTTEDILRRAGAAPDHTSFPTVDALNEQMESFRAQHPTLISVQRIGTSRLGEPISLYSIGDGARSALIVGGVHPNEPIGSLTILHLTEQLTSDAAFRAQLDTTWHIVPCADPDGMRLNEGWFADPSDRERYAREFYRPAPDEQVEWTFPFSYKKAYFDAMMPETQALARAIDTAKPDLYVPLHNSEGGGAYFYLSRAVPALYPLLHALPAALGVPLHTGEAEGAHFTVLAPAIYEMGTLQDAYDWTEAYGLDPYPPGSAGDASTSYAQKYGTLSLIAELPQFSDPLADDTTPTETLYREVLRESGEALQETGTRLTALVDRVTPFLRLDTPLLRAARVFAPAATAAGEENVARAAQESDRFATVSEVEALSGLVRLHRLRWGGMLVRALRAEVEAGTAAPELRRAAVEAQDLFDGWLEGALQAGSSRPLPLSAVVGVQYGAILAAHAQLEGASRWASD
ncbi:M14 family zinc carboxypeptidase [Microbacterium sp. TPD7012]|uniref:M14 family zinc carboxypeptidase n=1 Tax=Microbacterium sp. TPD7012 TaxID=2171975 RepID=UPI000D514F0B|nr:M14 family zinc carboxypeptidase [Microbacterium sp. TPD7012]PVE94008.1 peptidase M14 [Microbacterium sp. TPD7012]